MTIAYTILMFLSFFATMFLSDTCFWGLRYGKQREKIARITGPLTGIFFVMILVSIIMARS